MRIRIRHVKIATARPRPPGGVCDSKGERALSGGAARKASTHGCGSAGTPLHVRTPAVASTRSLSSDLTIHPSVRPGIVHTFRYLSI